MSDIEFIINKYILLRLEGKYTIIYVNGKRFIYCKRLILNIPKKDVDCFDEIESIDEASELYNQYLTDNKMFKEENGKLHSLPYSFNIPPETEFWGHCSNIQAWVEYDYDTRILHSNLAFPLLKELTKVGDPKAKRVFKEEISKRFFEGKNAQKIYLVKEKYLDYLNKEELESLIEEFIDSLKNLKYSEEKDKEIKCVVEIGLKYVKEEIVKKLIKKYKDFLNYEEDLCEFCFQLGRSCKKDSKYYKAIKLLKIGLEYNLKNVDAWMGLGTLYEIKNKYKEAVKTYKKVLEIDPTNLIALNQLGKTFRTMNHYDKAIITFKKALKADKYYLSTWENLSDIYTDIGKNRKAIRIVKRVLKFHPSKSIILNHLGLIYEELGFIFSDIKRKEQKYYAKAIKVYQQALKIDPEDYYLWHNLGGAYQKTEENNKAIDAYFKALEINQNDLYSLNDLIKIYNKKEDTEMVILLCEQALSICPSYNEPFGTLYDFYCKRKEYDNAIIICQNSLEYKKKEKDFIFPNDWIRLGKVFSSKGVYYEAKEAFIRALKINPREQEIWERLRVVCSANGDIVGEFIALCGFFKYFR